MSTRSLFEVFGLVIHGWSWPHIEPRIHDAVAHGHTCWIVTANPEILLAAHRDVAYWQALRQADVRTVDGFGLKIIGWLAGARTARQTGVELSLHLLERAEREGWCVGFFGGENGSADRAAWQMRERFSSLKIVTEQGGRVNATGMGDAQTDEAWARLMRQAPDVVLVALGHPKQERFIARHVTDMPTAKVVVGVGGTFDFWAGVVRRAPRWIRGIGMEWLWRLAVEPWRWRRMIDALVIFPLAALADRVAPRRAK